VLIMVQYFTIF